MQNLSSGASGASGPSGADNVGEVDAVSGVGCAGEVLMYLVQMVFPLSIHSVDGKPVSGLYCTSCGRDTNN